MWNQNQFNGGNPIQPQYPQFQQGFIGPAPTYNQFVPSTNKKFVKSLEEALSIPANLNSQNVYFDINKNVMYDICTNGNGEKSWSILNISLAQSSNNTTASVPAAGTYETRMKAIEDKLEELLNGKYNAKQADSANE